MPPKMGWEARPNKFWALPFTFNGIEYQSEKILKAYQTSQRRHQVKITFDTAMLAEIRAQHKERAPQFLMSLMESAHIQAKKPSHIHGWEITPKQTVRAVLKKAKEKVEDPRAKEILAFFNERAGKKFRPIEQNLSLIASLLKEYSREDIESVILGRIAKWKDTEREQYLCPSTVFRKRNFDNYLNEPKDIKLVEAELANELDALLGEA